mmetsp:Transcript_42110/g.136299  ORF Transcript_42110/g.136299 Transcript_42110/m.136299 type:complete len:218 (-) Transcript_42110:455-1108(-)
MPSLSNIEKSAVNSESRPSLMPSTCEPLIRSTTASRWSQSWMSRLVAASNSDNSRMWRSSACKVCGEMAAMGPLWMRSQISAGMRSRNHVASMCSRVLSHRTCKPSPARLPGLSGRSPLQPPPARSPKRSPNVRAAAPTVAPTKSPLAPPSELRLPSPPPKSCSRCSAESFHSVLHTSAGEAMSGCCSKRGPSWARTWLPVSDSAIRSGNVVGMLPA